jgi:hypothetical protein
MRVRAQYGADGLRETYELLKVHIMSVFCMQHDCHSLKSPACEAKTPTVAGALLDNQPAFLLSALFFCFCSLIHM